MYISISLPLSLYIYISSLKQFSNWSQSPDANNLTVVARFVTLQDPCQNVFKIIVHSKSLCKIDAFLYYCYSFTEVYQLIT